MVKLTFLAASLVVLACQCGDDKQAAKKGAAAPPPCICLLYEIDVIDPMTSMYWSSTHEANCEEFDTGTHNHAPNMATGECEEGNCIDNSKDAKAKKPTPSCLSAPKPDDYKPKVGAGMEIIYSQQIKFHVKKGGGGEDVLAKVFLIKATPGAGGKPPLGIVPVGWEIKSDDPQPAKVFDDKDWGKSVKKAKHGGDCQFVVEWNNIKYLVTTTEKK